MKAWFESLQMRERQLVVVAGTIIGLLFLYMIMWRPFVNHIGQLRSGMATATKNLAEVEQLQQEAIRLRKTTGGRRKSNMRGKSVLGLVEQTRASNQIPEAKRIEEEGKNGVRVKIEDVPFDKLVLWFGQLQRQFGINVVDLIIDKQDRQGLVNVRLIMQGPEK